MVACLQNGDGSCIRVLFVSPHRTQNPRPFELLAERSNLDVTVAYGAAGEHVPARGPEFLNRTAFDTPTDGAFPAVAPRNVAIRPSLDRFWGLIQPGLVSLVRQNDIVVVYGHAFASCWIAILAACLLRRPLILTTDATELRSPGAGAFRSRIKPLVLRLLYRRCASRVFVPSTAAQRFVRSCGVPDDRIVLTPYCVDETIFAAAESSISSAGAIIDWGAAPPNTAARWGVPDGVPVVAWVGKLIPRKRPVDVLYALTREGLDRVHLLLVGEGPELERVKSVIRENHLECRVHLVGLIPYSQLHEVYRAADVLVHSAEWEPFGLPVLEALLCGTPVIAAESVGAAQDLIVRGRNGALYPPGDIEALAGALLRVLGAPPVVQADQLEMFSSARNADVVATALLEIAP